MTLLGGLIGSFAFTGGCGGSVEEGTSVPFNEKADISRQDAMRAAMSKDKGSAPKGKGAPKHEQKEPQDKKEQQEEKKEQ